MDVDCSVNLYAGDVPYLYLDVKGVQFFVDFRAITACTPAPGAHIIQDYEDADPHEFDPVVPPWSRWLLLDDATLTLTNRYVHGFQLIYSRHAPDGDAYAHKAEMRLDANEAQAVADAVDAMLASFPGPMVAQPERVLTSRDSVLKHRVLSRSWAGEGAQADHASHFD